MNINQTARENKLCFSCTPEGAITKVLKDDDHLFSSKPPASFFEVFDKSSQQQSITFWENIINKSLVDQCKLNTAINPAVAAYNFSGFFNGQDVIITASKSDEGINNNLLKIISSSDTHPLKFEKIPFALKSPFVTYENIDENDALKNDIKNLKKLLLQKDFQIAELHEELRMVKANKEQFSFVASHDLKEPLRMIASYMGLLKRKFGEQLDGKAHTYIDFAINGSIRLQSIFNSLLDLSQISIQETAKYATDLNEIVEEVKKINSKIIREKGVEINVSTKLPTVKGYKKALFKLVDHLICNAIKFAQEDKNCTIEITVKEKEDMWEFCVADNGIGINEEAYNQIFAVFSKLNSGEKYPGNGIGLAICKKAAEHNGGSIWVKSIEGVGSNFYFTIPK